MTRDQTEPYGGAGSGKRQQDERIGDLAPVNTDMARGHMSYHAGLAAEDIVARYFETQGRKVLERRWRGRRGEIDLILSDGAGVVLVEVKQSRTFDRALAHLTPAQTRRLYMTGEEYLGTLPNGSLTDVRIDVALVDGHGAIQILENAIGHDF